MSHPLVCWHCGGDLVCAGGIVLSPSDAACLHDLYVDEARAAGAAGKHSLSVQALKLATELSEAAGAARRWRRASVRQVVP